MVDFSRSKQISYCIIFSVIFFYGLKTVTLWNMNALQMPFHAVFISTCGGSTQNLILLDMRKEKRKISHFRNPYIRFKAFSFQNHKPQINTACENLKRQWVCPQFQVNDDDSSCELIYQASGQVHSRPQRWGHNSALASIHSFLHLSSGCVDYSITDMSSTSYGLHSVAQVSGSSVIWRWRADTERSLGKVRHTALKSSLLSEMVCHNSTNDTRITEEEAAEVFKMMR